MSIPIDSCGQDPQPGLQSDNIGPFASCSVFPQTPWAAAVARSMVITRAMTLRDNPGDVGVISY